MHFNQMGDVNQQKLPSPHAYAWGIKAFALMGRWEEQEKLLLSVDNMTSGRGKKWDVNEAY